MTTCRLCSQPRVSPLRTWKDGKFVRTPLTVAESTGAFCGWHEAQFQGVRWSLYADMRIGQAVEAFCLAASTSLPSGR